jgi:2-dehydro-3-deoxyphosphogluconate aldolase / (4S)-4-hydroxy-2-oxoglutarate aldolase
MSDASPRSRAESVEALCESGLIAVLRADSADIAVRVAETLVAAGISVVEVTFTVPDAPGAIAALSRRLGRRVVLGAGTVTDAAAAKRALAAGAEFLVTPCLVPEVTAVARAAGVALLSGALTPTEVFTAFQSGADLVKVFPVESVGGPAYLRALRGPFPTIPLVPTGGVTLESVPAYFSAGAAAIGVGSELTPRDALRRGDFTAIGTLAARFLEAAREARRAR